MLKRLMVLLVVLLWGASAWATVDIWVRDTGNGMQFGAQSTSCFELARSYSEEIGWVQAGVAGENGRLVSCNQPVAVEGAYGNLNFNVFDGVSGSFLRTEHRSVQVVAINDTDQVTTDVGSVSVQRVMVLCVAALMFGVGILWGK